MSIPAVALAHTQACVCISTCYRVGLEQEPILPHREGPQVFRLICLLLTEHKALEKLLNRYFRILQKLEERPNRAFPTQFLHDCNMLYLNIMFSLNKLQCFEEACVSREPRAP